MTASGGKTLRQYLGIYSAGFNVEGFGNDTPGLLSVDFVIIVAGYLWPTRLWSASRIPPSGGPNEVAELSRDLLASVIRLSSLLQPRQLPWNTRCPPPVCSNSTWPPWPRPLATPAPHRHCRPLTELHRKSRRWRRARPEVWNLRIVVIRNASVVPARRAWKWVGSTEGHKWQLLGLTVTVAGLINSAWDPGGHFRNY